jgi:hypothetical protein
LAQHRQRICADQRLCHPGWIANTTGDSATSTSVVLQVLCDACVHRGPFRGYANAAITTLVDALAERLSRVDAPVDNPLAAATLLVAGLRGLIFDRLITGDAARADRTCAISPRIGSQSMVPGRAGHHHDVCDCSIQYPSCQRRLGGAGHPGQGRRPWCISQFDLVWQQDHDQLTCVTPPATVERTASQLCPAQVWQLRYRRSAH